MNDKRLDPYDKPKYVIASFIWLGVAIPSLLLAFMLSVVLLKRLLLGA